MLRHGSQWQASFPGQCFNAVLTLREEIQQREAMRVSKSLAHAGKLIIDKVFERSFLFYLHQSTPLFILLFNRLKEYNVNVKRERNAGQVMQRGRQNGGSVRLGIAKSIVPGVSSDRIEACWPEHWRQCSCCKSVKYREFSRCDKPILNVFFS